MRPPGGPLSGGPLCSHVLLVELADRLLLVDSGFGRQDVRSFGARLPESYRRLVGAHRDGHRSAVEQVRALGFDPADVRDIVLTHLDPDHAGGLSDFPWARVHLLGEEHRLATTARGPRARSRYHPVQWAHGPRWVLHEPRGERWRGLRAVRQLGDLPPEVLVLPLPGHTRGHCAVALQCPERGWLVHAGDAYLQREELLARRRHLPPALRLATFLFAEDEGLRRRNVARLAELQRRHEDVTVFCAHDARELSALQRGQRP